MATEALQPALYEQNIMATLPVRYYDLDGVGVVYDDQFYLYDEYGDRVPETIFHSTINRYIFDVLQWRYHNHKIAGWQFLEYRFDRKLSQAEITMRQAKFPPGSVEANMTTVRAKVEPDLALFLDREIVDDIASIAVGEDQDFPSPDLIIETASASTKKRDLGIKFQLYQDALKAREYIIFDPHQRRVLKGSRFRGWRLVNQIYVPLEQQGPNRFWSEVLQSWYVVEGRFLYLEDTAGNRLLTELEFTKADRDQERAEKERERAEKNQIHAQLKDEQIERGLKQIQLERTELQLERERLEKRAAELRIAELEARLQQFEKNQ